MTSTRTWSRNERLALVGVVVAGILIRLVLLPTDGLRGDIDQFVGWVHALAVNGLATLYNGTEFGPVAFGPVMAYVWAVLAAVQPAFATVTDSADPAIRALMKLPASLADLGLAAIVVWALRDRPRWAVIGAAAILLHPAVIYVSAWWGQYESIFLLTGLGAVVAAINGRNGLAAALIAAALMTKPQAVAFVVPFIAWFWASGYATAGARGGVIALARAALIGFATLVVLWLPFLAAAGPIRYIEGLGMYQTEVFRILSLNAWNAWWLLQEAAGGHFLADDTAVLGPLAPRHLGYLATVLLSLVVAAAIVRTPRAPVLILGVTASVMVVFTFMTQMHERYAYAALIIPVLLLSHRPTRWWWLAFSVVFFLNLVAAAPASPEIEALVPVVGPLGVVGALAMTGLCIWSVFLTRRASLAGSEPEPGPEPGLSPDAQGVAEAPGR
jgi:dolichyl-phosphate-mannose-protein mannosyltransferase